MIGVNRSEISTHLGHPGAPLRPTSGQAPCFVDQLVSKNRRVVTIHDARNGVPPSRNLFNVFTIKPPRRLVRVKEHRLLVVDSERVFVVVRAMDTGPPQILSDAARVAPPVSQTQLHAQSVMRGFRDRAIQKHKLSLVPLVGFTAKPAIPPPVACRLNVFRATFTRSPNTDHLNAG